MRKNNQYLNVRIQK